MKGVCCNMCDVDFSTSCGGRDDCNLNLGLRKETAGTSHVYTVGDDVCLAGMLQDAIGRTVC